MPHLQMTRYVLQGPLGHSMHETAMLCPTSNGMRRLTNYLFFLIKYILHPLGLTTSSCTVSQFAASVAVMVVVVGMTLTCSSPLDGPAPAAITPEVTRAPATPVVACGSAALPATAAASLGVSAMTRITTLLIEVCAWPTWQARIAIKKNPIAKPNWVYLQMF